MSEHHLYGEDPKGKYLLYLALGALGIVFGDIGTSPLYAFRESFHDEYGIAVTPANVLGILSLIFWALVLIISVKYVMFVMRADNRGEGGMIALTALVTPVARPGRRRWVLILLGLFGTSLLYGDGMITPAISVLSAVEGLGVATPFFDPYIIPIVIAILVALFAVQRKGTSGVGGVFGPVMVVWFAILAALGASWVVREPGVLRALSPAYGFNFFADNGWRGFLVLGSVFLVVTGGEALYADMGHFGRRPIKLAWFAAVLPALLLNYFGQGALLLRDPRAVDNPFFHMAPEWALYPLVVMATLAAVIASQALISGAFSLTMQAVQLGYMPRMHIEHTSERQRGQIYIPSINWVLMLACIGLVLGFGSSSRLAAAYGVAVTTDMVFSTILFATFAYDRWKWSLPAVVAMAAGFLVIDLAFWGANILKVPAGGWFPLMVGAIVFTLMTTWKKGRQILSARQADSALPWDFFAHDMVMTPMHRVPGTAVFMYGNPNGTPPALLHSLKHYKVLHEQVVLLAVKTEDIPYVPAEDRVRAETVDEGFYRVTVRYGFMQDPDIPHALELANYPGLDLSPMNTTYFLGRETLIATKHKSGMAMWRENLFAVMSRNARTATSFFHLPPNRVVELGAQIEL